MKHATIPQNHRGFTLVELLAVIAVLAFTLMLASPSLTEFQRNSVLTNTTNTLVSNIYRARSEAMKTGKIAIMVPGDGTTNDWKQGWMIFIDNDLSNTYNTGDEVVLKNTEQLPAYLDIEHKGGATLKNTTIPAVIFNASGFSRNNENGAAPEMTFSIWRNEKDTAETPTKNFTRRIKLGKTGRLRTCRPESASDTKCLREDPTSSSSASS